MRLLANQFGVGDKAVLLLSFLFLTFANVSHTIALRYVILTLLLLLALGGWLKSGGAIRSALPVVQALLAFLGYALLHTCLLSWWPQISGHELYSQLLMGGLWFLAALWLFQCPRGLSIADLVILAGAVLATVEFCHGAYLYFRTGQWPFMDTYTMATKLEFSFFMNFVLGFIVAAFCFGGRSDFRHITFLPRWFLVLVSVLILFVSLKAGARNGMIGLVYLMLSMLFVFMVFEGFRVAWYKALSIVLLVVMIAASIGIYTIHQDPRSHAFVESAHAGWDYQSTKAWLRTEPYPKMSTGEIVDASAYERIAWIHSGLDLIVAKPMGYGFSRNAFSLALTETGHSNRVGHSHSGFIDLGLGLGVPGILLWLVFCFLLLQVGLRAFTRRHDVLGLVLMLVTGGFVGRMILESINKDHMLHIFLFTVAALLAEMQQRQGEAGL